MASPYIACPNKVGMSAHHGMGCYRPSMAEDGNSDMDPWKADRCLRKVEVLSLWIGLTVYSRKKSWTLRFGSDVPAWPTMSKEKKKRKKFNEAAASSSVWMRTWKVNGVYPTKNNRALSGYRLISFSKMEGGWGMPSFPGEGSSLFVSPIKSLLGVITQFLIILLKRIGCNQIANTHLVAYANIRKLQAHSYTLEGKTRANDWVGRLTLSSQLMDRNRETEIVNQRSSMQLDQRKWRKHIFADWQNQNEPDRWW